MHIRNWLFYPVSFIITLIFMIISLPLLISSRSSLFFIKTWARLELWLLKIFAGITVQMKDLNISKQGNIIACKHQSTLEILAIQAYVPNTVFFLKSSLLYVPLVNLFLLRTGQITVSKNKKNNNDVFDRAIEKLKNNNIVIFPEGTRVNPYTENTHYYPGVIILAKKVKLPIIPIATNAGYFWMRRTIEKKKGIATIQQLPKLDLKQHSIKEGLKQLQQQIDCASKILLTSAEEQ